MHQLVGWHAKMDINVIGHTLLAHKVYEEGAQRMFAQTGSETMMLFEELTREP